MIDESGKRLKIELLNGAVLIEYSLATRDILGAVEDQNKLIPTEWV